MNPYGQYFFLLSASLFSFTSSAGGPSDEEILSHKKHAVTPVAEIKREVTPPQVELCELDIWKGRARKSTMAVVRLLGDLEVAQDDARASREKAAKWEAKTESVIKALQNIRARLGDVEEELEFGIL